MLTLEQTANVAAKEHAASPAGRAAVVSLHFSPAHASHILAYGKLLRSLGFAVCFVLDELYLNFADFSAIGPVVSAAQYRSHPDAMPIETAIFYNAAVANAWTARRMRAHGIDVLYVFHEPVPVAMRLGEGWKEILKLIAAKFCSIAMLRQSSAVLVACGYARGLYDRHFSKYNPSVYTFPLLFEDECSENRSVAAGSDRSYFSFLGYAVKAHDFDGFVNFAKYAIRAGSCIQFAIATRSDLSEYLAGDEELARYGKEGCVLIQHGKALSNEEMNSFCARSFCVWNVYKCSTQSGALVRAFMAGTPVVAVRTGSFPEFIEPGVNGEFVEAADKFNELLRAAEKIRANIDAYAEGSRRSFLDTFDYRANRKRFARILAATRKETPACA